MEGSKTTLERTIADDHHYLLLADLPTASPAAVEDHGV